MIEHRAALNTVRDVNQHLGWSADDRIITLSALSFDLSVQDVYGGLAAGATLVMPAPEEDKDPAAWARLVQEQRVTVWNSVPALAELLTEQAEHSGADLRSLRLVMLSGDWIPPTLPDRLRALAPGVRVVSLGGATEGSIWSVWYDIAHVDPKWTSIPYGRPMANQTLHILDRSGCDAPVGVAGELHIGGVGLATGYWRDPERTAAAFVTHARTGERLYRTGDLARCGPDGTIEFLGRADSQVKIRGYRVELGEIEAHLGRHPDVVDCAVVTLGQRGARELAGYAVPRDGAPLDVDDLRGYLADRLPAYMVPTYLTAVPRIPLTANGKVDRKRLPAPRRTAPAGGAEPSTATERLVAGVWAAVLGVESVGADDDFFAIGGHSLLAIKVVTRLRRELPAGSPGVAVMDMFRAPTVRALAALLDKPAAERPRHLLHRLTAEPAEPPALSYVCVPYGGGSAIVYQPLADALPDGYALWSLAIPGHDVGLDEEHLPFDVLAARCAAEVLDRVSGPIVLYGHCGVGSALIVEVARRLEEAGREVEATYIGAIFPFARPRAGAVAALSRAMNRLRGDQHYVNWLAGLGVDLADVDPAQARQIVRNMRRDSEAAEEYFTRLLDTGATRLRCPIIAVAGERDPATEWYDERFREWHFLTDRTALVVLDEAGHFFLKYRAEELAEIVTSVHPAVAGGTPVPARTGWWLQGVSETTGAAVPSGPEPSMRRFLWVMLGQLVSMTGAALTDFAIPLWIYLETGSLTRFAVFFLVGLLPGLLIAPLAGGIVDRYDRRRVMLAADTAALGVQLAFGLLLWTGNLPTAAIYGLLASLSVALTFQRLAFFSAVPQLVPKRYLGHANGVVQTATGVAQFVAPLVAVGLLATIDLTGILVLDVVSYAFAIVAVLLVRFPATMAYRRRESLLKEIAGGLRYTLSHRGIRSMLLFFAALNIFLSPLLLLSSPLVLSFADLSTVGRVAFGGGFGVLLGGLAMMVWGGPRRRRMRGLLLGTLAMAACCLLTGLRPATLTVAIGIFGTSLCLTVVNAIYATIVQVTVPQRFHGRVFSLNTIVAWSTLPLGFAVIVPFGPRLFEPLMAAGGPLAGTVGQLIGTGDGRGIGLMYLVFALAMAALAAVSLRLGTLSRFDAEVPEAPPDDLYGREAVAAKRGTHDRAGHDDRRAGDRPPGSRRPARRPRRRPFRRRFRLADGRAHRGAGTRAARRRPAARHLLRRRHGQRPGRRRRGGPVSTSPPATAPLTTAQERIWFLGQVGDDYHVPMSWRLRGPLDVAALCAAIQDAVGRHGALRTRFPARDGRPVQEVLPDWRLPVERLDATEEEAADIAAARIVEPFDLAAAPPVRATLLRIAAADHVLCVVTHHLVADDISIGILGAEVAAGYAARVGGEIADPAPLPVQYADYARDERAAADAGREEVLRYWTERLAGIRPLDLPTDRPRPAAPTTDGGTESLRSAQAAADLRTLCRAGRTTAFMTSLAAYLALLGLYSGQDDIAVGSPVDTRDRVELEPLVGFFLDTVVLRGDLSGDPTVRELLGRVKATLIGAYQHRKAPLEELPARLGLRRDPSRTPLFDTMFIYHAAQASGLALPGLDVGWFDTGLARAKFDLLVDVLAGRDEVTLIASYRSDLFDSATIALLLRRLETFLHLAAADPDARLSTVYSRLAAAEAPAETACARPAPVTGVVERIWAQAAATPHAIAVDAPDGRLTYAELVDRAERESKEVHSGALVEVRREPGAGLVVAVLAVLRAGAAYLPLDPAHPRRASTRGDGDGVDGLAYVMHTSGSTGAPKPVAVGHTALATRVEWMAEAYGIGPGDRVLQLSSPGFDTFGEEVYPCLSRGATLVVPPVARAELPDFLATPAGRALTVLDLPTAYWHELVTSLPASAWPDALRLVVIGGEQARADVLARWFEGFGDRVALWNTYGPTEATIIATAARLTPADAGRRPPIGRPIAGTCAHVRDRHGGPVPDGVPGELYLGGPGLASGYLGRPDLSEGRFVDLDGVRHYRTGDRVRTRPDGALEFLGRTDHQLKVRGHRIEPEEVEGALTGYPGIRDAAVTLDGGRLVAHLVLEPGTAPPGAADLRAHLAGLLPAAFHPEAFAVRGALPLTSNGKLDRAALPPVDVATSAAPGEPPSTDAERLIAAVWSEVLAVERIGAHDDFFDLGGHSLLATRVAARLRARLGLEVPLRLIFRATTVRALAEAVEDLLLAEIEAMDEAEAQRLTSS
ncbi:hypothetical protein Phou_004810 [Phytohabitans houttuyneae]|uniref:Carrier domain-containing protein n=1 Tax=Phytohabitans houttuyneae TaxID=1076126 RepID=A0A6V8K1Q2_9ACTN|nr:hypothetical protein Phou_004810 [Phytohabitans houttuyneae]